MSSLCGVAAGVCPLCGYRLDEDHESVYCPNCGWRPIMLTGEAPDE
jgi:exosome complex RNA-binding protein Csl4